MNNEEKILGILVEIQSDVAELKADVAELKADVAELKADVAELKTDVSDLKGRMSRVELTQENVVLPKLDLLAEGHVSIQRQIREINVIDRMQDDIFTLKAAVKYLSSELDSLKSAM